MAELSGILPNFVFCVICSRMQSIRLMRIKKQIYCYMELGICAGSISENSSNIDEQQNVHTHSGRYAYQVYMHSNSLHSMNNTYEYLRFCFNWI